MNYYHHDVDGHGGQDGGDFHNDHVEFTGYHDAPDGNNQGSYGVDGDNDRVHDGDEGDCLGGEMV